MENHTVELIHGSAEDASPNEKEALRYLGYRGASPDETVSALIESCTRELLSLVKPLCCFARTGIEFTDGGVDLGFGEIKSKDLAKHLRGCTGAILFAATIGVAPDRLIAKYSRVNKARSVIIDALSSSMAESWCDSAERIITKNETHCMRFSPGYGDFALSHQRDFMSCLDMNRRLGITLSDSLLMMPTKSVTAVIGIGAKNTTCGHKCAVCENTTCIYRSI